MVTRIGVAARRVVLVGTLLFAWAGVPTADAYPDLLTAAVQQAFQPLMARYHVPGLVVATTIDGRQRFFEFGVASRDRGQPVSRDTIFEIGSVSKTFATTLASYADTVGSLSLSADHPSRYEPALAGTALDAATLLDLGTYTAGGLPQQFPAEVRDEASMLTYFRQWRPDDQPGRERLYSNPSIGLLGHVTALALHDTYANLVATRLLPALGLSHSYVRVPDADMDRYAWGYDSAGKPVRVNPGVLDDEAYGIKSSAADMLRYVEANIAPERIVTSDVRAAVERTHLGYDDVGSMVQGLGWEQYPFPVPLDRLLAGTSTTMATRPHPVDFLGGRTPEGPTLFNKTGSTDGFGAYAAFVPDRGIGIVMLANANFPIPARVTAADAVLRELATETRG